MNRAYIKRVLLIPPLCLPWLAQAQVYLVRQGDNLSKIAHQQLGGPVWGAQGTLKILQKLNPHIADQDRIYPGQPIVLEQVNTEVSKVEEVGLVEEPRMEREVAVETSKAKAAFEITPAFSFTNLELIDVRTGGHSIVTSQYHLKLEGKYLQEWSEKFRSFVAFNLGHVNFSEAQNVDKKLENRNKTLFGLKAGAEYSLTSSLRVEGYLKYQQEMFVRATSSTRITVDQVALPSLGTKVSYDFHHANPFTLGFSVSGEMNMAAQADSYDVKSGTSYGAAIYLKQKQFLKNWNVQTDLGYYQRSQDTDIAEQKEKAVIFSLRFF